MVTVKFHLQKPRTLELNGAHIQLSLLHEELFVNCFHGFSGYFTDKALLLLHLGIAHTLS